MSSASRSPAPTDGTAALAIVPPREGQQAGVDTRVALATDDVDAEMMGGEGPVPRMFCFRDPDGNNFLVVEDQPGT